jgi:hypothetical protein
MRLLLAPMQEAYCQKFDLLKSEFLATHNLKRIENKDSIKQIEQKITSIIHNDNRNKNKLFFNFWKRWKLDYTVQTGYRENFPNQYKDTTGLPQFQRLGTNHLQRLATTSYLTPGNKTIALSGLKIFKIFGVKKHIDYYPEIYARDSRFNGQWTAISLNKEYLIIRYVSSYPDGNQTSWYHEETYYFKRRESTDK